MQLTLRHLSCARSFIAQKALYWYIFLASPDGNRTSCADCRQPMLYRVRRTVLLSLGLHSFPGELAFNHTSQLYNLKRQRHSLWGPRVTWPCLMNFGGIAGWKKSLAHIDVLCRKGYWPGGAGTRPVVFNAHLTFTRAKFGHWDHFASLRGSFSHLQVNTRSWQTIN